METESTQDTGTAAAQRWLRASLAWEATLDRLRALDSAPRLSAIAGTKPTAPNAEQPVHRVA